jgi:hypothetical protein
MQHSVGAEITKPEVGLNTRGFASARPRTGGTTRPQRRVDSICRSACQPDCQQTNRINVKSEVRAAVHMNSEQWGLLGYDGQGQTFRGTCRLHLQGRRIK